MKQQALIDAFGRQLTYLRLSVTDRCDLRCLYCMPADGLVPVRRREDQLTVEEMLRLVGIFTSLGVTKVRLTGGEPLIYRGLEPLLKGLSHLECLQERVLTTNGTHLLDHLEMLQKTGIQRLNISLDTLDAKVYKDLTRGGDLSRVLDGIEAAKKAGLGPIRINAIALGGLGEDNMDRLIEWARSQSVELRFIEWMTLGTRLPEGLQPMTYEDITQKLLALGFEADLSQPDSSSAAQVFVHEGTRQRIGCIGGQSKHFCHTCNRLRLTSDGFLKWCLFSGEGLDLKRPLRQGTSDEVLQGLILDGVSAKPQSGSGAQDFRVMSQIGG